MISSSLLSHPLRRAAGVGVAAMINNLTRSFSTTSPSCSSCSCSCSCSCSSSASPTPDEPKSFGERVNNLSKMMDSLNNFIKRGVAQVGRNKGLDSMVDQDALYVRMEMPGLGLEHVKVCMEDDKTLLIQGEGDHVDEVEESRMYIGRVDLGDKPNIFKMEEMTVESKYGVLKLIVPKVKEDV